MPKKKSKYLKSSRGELISHPLAILICKLLSEKKEMTTTDILNEIKKRRMDFEKLHRRTLLQYLNTLEAENIITGRKTLNNVEYWKLGQHALNSLERLLPEIDAIRIQRYRLFPDWNYTDSGITIYELPIFHMDEDVLQGEFKALIEELKEWRKRFFLLNVKVAENWKKKVVNNLFALDINILDMQLASLYCHLSNTDYKLRDRWFKNVEHGSAEIVAEVELAKIFKKYFYPEETEGQICKKLYGHEMGKEATEIMYAYKNLRMIYPYSIASTVVVRIPEMILDNSTYETLINTYRQEQEHFHLDHSNEIEKVKRFMQDHIKGFYSKNEETCDKPDAIESFGEFIDFYAPKLKNNMKEK